MPTHATSPNGPPFGRRNERRDGGGQRELAPAHHRLTTGGARPAPKPIAEPGESIELTDRLANSRRQSELADCPFNCRLIGGGGRGGNKHANQAADGRDDRPAVIIMTAGADEAKTASSEGDRTKGSTSTGDDEHEREATATRTKPNNAGSLSARHPIKRKSIEAAAAAIAEKRRQEGRCQQELRKHFRPVKLLAQTVILCLVLATSGSTRPPFALGPVVCSAQVLKATSGGIQQAAATGNSPSSSGPGKYGPEE
jgi:hypothetical protein